MGQDEARHHGRPLDVRKLPLFTHFQAVDFCGVVLNIVAMKPLLIGEHKERPAGLGLLTDRRCVFTCSRRKGGTLDVT